MPASRLNIIFGIVTMLVLVPYLTGWVLPSGFDTWVLIVSLAVTGIPHGAIDHVIFIQNQKGSGQKSNLFKSFFTPYLIMIGTTFVLWFVIPQFMFLFFLMVAAYHFGQSQLFYISLAKKSMKKTMLYLSWGSFILSSLWFFHWNEQSTIIKSVFDWNLATSGLIYTIVLLLLILSGLATGFLLLYFYRKQILPGKMLLQEFAVLGLLTAIFSYTPPFIAFAIYFGLWHATRVIFTEYHFLKNRNGQKLLIFSFVKSFLPFSILSFLGLGLLFWFSRLLQASISPFMLFLIFISALTMPHAYFMEQMYQFLGKARKNGESTTALQIS